MVTLGKGVGYTGSDPTEIKTKQLAKSMGWDLKYQQPGNTGQDTSTEGEKEQEIAMIIKNVFWFR